MVRNRPANIGALPPGFSMPYRRFVLISVLALSLTLPSNLSWTAAMLSRVLSLKYVYKTSK